jgi:hypothetical protein
MEEMIGQFASLGAVGMIAYVLFKNTLEEKKQDRKLYEQSVNTFMETSKQYKEGNERIEQKLDNFINSKGE